MGEWNNDNGQPKVIKGFVHNRDENPEVIEPNSEQKSDTILDDVEFRNYYSPLIELVEGLVNNSTRMGCYSGGEFHVIRNTYLDIQDKRREDLINQLGLTDLQRKLLNV